MNQLSNYVEILLGGTPATNRPEFWDGIIPWVSIVDFTDSKKIFITEKTITEEGLNLSNTKLLHEGNLIVSARGTVGKIAVCGTRMAFNQSCYALITKDSKTLSQNYLFYLLQEKIKYLKQMAVGGVFNTIIKSTLEKIPVELPGIDAQENVADILSVYDDLIDTNHHSIQLLKESARLLFREWFVYFNFPYHEKIKIVDGVPEGWKKEKLNKLVSLLGGYSFKSSSYQQEGKYGIVTIKNVQQGSFVPECTDYLDDAPNVMKKHCFLSSGDILLSLTGNVGRVCLVYGEDYLLNQRVAKIEPKNSIPKSFIYWMFEDSMMQKRIENLSYGSAQQNLSPVKLGEQKVILPPIQLLNSFDEIVSLINLEIIQLLKQNQNLAQARDLLLPRLMSGAIEV
jgi:type I restriction enzyme S subunit